MVSSNWDRVSLGDICRVEAGAGFPIVHQGLKDQEFPFFKVGDMNTLGNEREMRVHEHSISDETRKKLRAIAFPVGTVVFPKIGAAIATNKKRLIIKPSCVDNNVMALIPSENLDSSFLFYLLLNKDLSDFANTGNPPSIRQSNVEEWVIPLPPLTEQKRIASLLARADRLRHLRRTAHELGESLLQSVFLEMFGDEQKQNYVTIQELMDSEVIVDMQDGNHGGDYPRTSEFVSEGIPFLTATNVIGNRVFLDSAPRLKPERAHKLRIGWVKPDDVLLSHNATVGRVAIMPNFDGEVVLGTSLTYYRLNPEVLLPRYFSGILQSRHFQAQLESFMGQTTRNQVPITRQRELFVPVPPPLNLQEEFAGVVARVESLRGRMSEGERQVEGLFESLLSQSFDGGR